MPPKLKSFEARTIQELKEMSEADLIEQHDNAAGNTIVGLSYYQDELRYRAQARVASRMLWLTIVITLATLVNVGVVIYIALCTPSM